MGFVKKLSSLIYKHNEIIYSGLTSIFTKYGRYESKAYKDDNQEYIAIMSRNFFTLKEPIVYIHSDEYTPHAHEHGVCYCNNQMEMALKMISKSGGLVLYSSTEARSIDGFLHEINTRRLETEKRDKHRTRVKFDIDEQITYPSLAFILQDLRLERIKVITNDLKIVHVINQLGIEIIKREASISFGYGNNMPRL